MPKDEILSLFMAHRHALVNYANGIVGDRGRAEDVVQEAFPKFREAAIGRFIEEPVGYLYRIVRNLALDGRRRALLEAGHVAGDIDSVIRTAASEEPSAEAALIAREDLRRVMAALAELPERTRIAVEMHRFGGCKLREIAEHLGISVSMAHVLVTEGIRHCQRSL